LDLGGWWDKSESSVSMMSVNVKYSAPRDVCGFRLNVAEGNPPGKWLCEGNGSTALLDTATSVYCTFDGRTATRADLRTWSAPGGSAAGCSAVWLLQPGVPGCW